MDVFEELRQRVWRCNMDLFEKNLVIQTFGNVSGIDRQRNVIVIKPSGVPYPDLTPEKMVLVDLDNNVIGSQYRPSSDTKSHLVLYRSFPGLGGIVHTHSTYATAWAQAKRPIPCLGTTHADHVSGEIPCTEDMGDEQIRGDYETETARQIVKRFAGISPDEVEMVLVAGHGPFTWGKTPEDAVYHSVILEELARMALLTLIVNPDIGNLSQSLIDKHYLRKHGKDAYYGQK